MSPNADPPNREVAKPALSEPASRTCVYGRFIDDSATPSRSSLSTTNARTSRSRRFPILGDWRQAIKELPRAKLVMSQHESGRGKDGQATVLAVPGFAGLR